jgi:outer membrane protein
MRRHLHVLLILLISLGACLAQTTNKYPRPLSLNECIELALRHNFDLQITRYDPTVARFMLAGAYGVYDPEFSFIGEHEHRRSPGGVDDEGRSFGGPETDANSFGTGIQGLLPWGLSYSLGGSITDEHGTRPDSQDDPANFNVNTNSFLDINSGNTISFVETNFAQVTVQSPFESTEGRVGVLDLRQPLLRNFWVDAPRLRIFLSKQDVKTSELTLRQQIMRTITEVQVSYCNYIYTGENVSVQERAVELAERLLAENKRRVEIGALAPLDEKQAEAQAASSRADLQSARAQRETAERVLKLLLSDNYTGLPSTAVNDGYPYPKSVDAAVPSNAWANVLIEPTDKLTATPQQFNLQASWTAGLAKRPELLIAREDYLSHNYRVRYQQNQLYPQLDLIGRVGYSGQGEEFNDAFHQISDGDNPFYAFGAQLTVPLSRRAERNAYGAAKATRDQAEIQIRQIEQTILVGIEDAIANAQTTLANVDARHEARLYAEVALDAEQKKLETGKSTSFVVLQLQRDLTVARSAEIRALADYNIALARLAFSEGTTLERQGVVIENDSGSTRK